MNRYRREEEPGLYHALEVYECPPPLMELSIALASDFVCIENVRPTRAAGEWTDLRLQMHADDPVSRYSVRNAVFDLSMTRDEFRHHLRFWDRNGVYAVFTRRGPLAFRATDLQGPARYRAMRNFDWTLELAIPGPSGGEWGRIASPDPAIIQQVHDAALVCYEKDG